MVNISCQEWSHLRNKRWDEQWRRKASSTKLSLPASRGGGDLQFSDHWSKGFLWHMVKLLWLFGRLCSAVQPGQRSGWELLYCPWSRSLCSNTDSLNIHSLKLRLLKQWATGGKLYPNTSAADYCPSGLCDLQSHIILQLALDQYTRL